MYKVKNDLSPLFMKELFCEINRETRSGRTYTRPDVRTVKKSDRSLRSFGPIVWNNMVPDNFKQCESLDLFKTSIKSWRPSNCVCELCKDYVKGLGYTVLFE